MQMVKMTCIFLKEQLRAPFNVIWTVSSPVVLFFFLHYEDIKIHSGDKAWLNSQVHWFVGYISFSVILFSYCLYLNGRRESGFISTFIHDAYSKYIFIFSQLLASVFMSLIYVLFFLFIVYAGFQVRPGMEILRLTFYSSVITFFLMFSLTWLATIPVTFQTANIIFSVMVTVSMVFGIISFRVQDGIVGMINIINPLLIYSKFLGGGVVFSAEFVIFYSAMSAISLISIFRFKTDPVWSSQ